MAVSRSELEIIIGLQDKASSALRGLTGNLKTLGTVALSAAAGGIAALGAGLGLLASKAIPAASNLNEALNATRVIFGETAEEIQRFGEIASKTAGLSRREFNQMAAETGAMLLNFGIDLKSATKGTIDLTQRAADMASIFNTEVGDALAAIQSGLQGMSLPLRRFGVDLSDIAIKAKAMEMGLGDITRQTDSAAYAQAAMALLMEQTDRIAGDFVNTSGDLANAQRIAKAELENLLATLGSIALPVLGQFFKLVSSQILPALNNFANYIKDVAAGGPLIGEAFMKLPKFLQPIAKFLGRLISAFKAFFSGLKKGESPISLFGKMVFNLSKAFGATSEQAGKIKEIFLGVVEFITGLKDQIMEVIGPFVSWKDVLIALGIAIATVIIPLIGGLIGALAPIILTFAAVILAVAVLRNAWENNWGGIRDKVQAVIAFLVPLIRGFITSIQAWWAQNGEQIIARAKAIWDGIVNGINAFIAWAGPLISGFIQSIRDWWAEHGEGIIAKVQEIWDGILAIFDFFAAQFKTLFEAFQLALEGDWRAFGEKLREGWDRAWNAFKEVVTTFGTWVGGQITILIDNIRTWFTETDWAAVGTSIIQGIANGITAAAGIIKDAALRAAAAAFEAVKGFFGIDSPSKKFMLVGQSLMQGMAQGVRQNISEPVRAATQAAAETVPQIPQMQGWGSSLSITIPAINVYGTEGTTAIDIANEVVRIIMDLAEANRGGDFAGLSYAG
ncbi:MAG: hypothetical protein UY48_C0001G0041 [Candidatus Gottesmanbacteria bacterium GW2011_GWB1_49_7]|uniref:Uncharacterized protein n=1 Tax=Candidatus Gottesmanbacteria bacterium GW2011_GWB1_49_7 TaxID=1618448 RepID=A0A0G1W489_9BACT|nr:MAG: hypothetical protein UY48_C0001G0041 [Candidatus Gottesmanbacteria bacterium GW2011_GWB1_49_7]